MEKNVTNNYGKLLDSMRLSVRQSEIIKHGAGRKSLGRIPSIHMPVCKQ